MDKIEIPHFVISALEKVRQSGKHNMHFAGDVFREMFEMGLYDAVLWLGKDVRNWEVDEDHDEAYMFAVDALKYSKSLYMLGQINSFTEKFIDEVDHI